MTLKSFWSRIAGWACPKTSRNVPLVLKEKESYRDPFLPYSGLDCPKLVNLSSSALPNEMLRWSGRALGIEAGIFELEDCIVPPGASNVISKGNAYPEVFNYEVSDVRHLLALLREEKQKSSQHISGTVAILGCSHHTNYYHWLFDNLARLQVIASSELAKEEFTILCPERGELLPFQMASIEMLVQKFPFLKVVYRERFREYRISRLVVPQFLSRERLFHPLQLEFLRDSFVAKPTEIREGERIYVTRDKAGARGIRNEDDLLKLLIPRGFQKVDPGKMTFGEQVDLFSRSAFVIGAHGAALSNLVFSKNALVIELFGRWYSPCYFILSSVLGHRYVCVGTGAHEDDQKNAGVVANIRAISDYLDRLDCF